MYLEIAFLISSIGIIIFLTYKVLVTKKEQEKELEEKSRNKYDPVEHVFSIGAIVLDGGLRGVRKISSIVKKTQSGMLKKRKEQSQVKRDEVTANRGASSFYIKSISEYKKTIRNKIKKPFDND